MPAQRVKATHAFARYACNLSETVFSITTPGSGQLFPSGAAGRSRCWLRSFVKRAFLVVSCWLSHVPIVAPPNYFEGYDAEIFELPRISPVISTTSQTIPATHERQTVSRFGGLSIRGNILRQHTSAMLDNPQTSVQDVIVCSGMGRLYSEERCSPICQRDYS